MTDSDQTLVKSAARSISVAFDLSDVDALEPANFMNIIRSELLNRIIKMLATNPERLMALLYRIDVDENRVKEIFASSIPDDIPELLVDLVIERQLAKAATRRAAKKS